MTITLVILEKGEKGSMKKITAILLVLITCILVTACATHRNGEHTDKINTAGSETESETEITDTNVLLYTNRSSGGKIYGDGKSIFYANVFDDMKLYRYDIDSDSSELMTDAVNKVDFISEYEDKIYFSSLLASENNRSICNVYRIDKDGQNLELLLENSDAPLVVDGYLYYHDYYDNYVNNVYRMDLESGESEKLLSEQMGEWSKLTINLADNVLYAYNLVDIYTLDLGTKELKNITEGMYAERGGINKVQYSNGYLYYYTYGFGASIMRYDISSEKHETVCTANDGNFWHDVLLVDGNSVIFTGRQIQALEEGQDESEFVRGVYLCNSETGEIEQLSNQPLGSTCYLYDGCIISLQSEEEGYENKIVVMDYDGNTINKYPGLTNAEN
ncbi:MAG: DUF5050 domain-containing protein [Ruminococcaceae bacterium]|nr:DUF5050 domain-containing protein [Oscillospiraceae bacterium]